MKRTQWVKCVNYPLVSALLALSITSLTAFSEESKVASTKPNVLLIVADDLGFSDIGSFGGEIPTPTLDSLARSGVRFSQFYTTPNCSPTRAMLLTGEDHHRAGLGSMAEALRSFPMLKGKPGYEGFLLPKTRSIAEVFSNNGYGTYIAGKWHLGLKPEHMPSVHGFDRSFVLLQGGGDHFGVGQNGGASLQRAHYREDGQPTTYPTGEFSSDVYASRLIHYLESEKEKEKPFFAYLAFTAPHWPLQASEGMIARHEGKYDMGPSALKRTRLEGMRREGLLRENVSDVPEAGTYWADLTDDQRRLESRYMEIYAAMVESIDVNTARVIDYLRDRGDLENTIIFFMSDNGAEGIDRNALVQRTGSTSPEQFRENLLATLEEANRDLSQMGSSDSFLTYGRRWAEAATAPGQLFKGHTYEGGVRAPAFISGPGVLGSRIVHSKTWVRDVMPTLLEMAGIDYGLPETESIVTSLGKVSLPNARSMAPVIEGEQSYIRGELDAFAWELHLSRGVRVGPWKAVFTREGRPGGVPRWSLHNLDSDPYEKIDVSSKEPGVMKSLLAVWSAYAEANGVVVPGPRTPN